MNLELPTEDPNIWEIVTARREKALRPLAFAANLLHPEYRGRSLTVNQVNEACDFIIKNLSEQGRSDFTLYSDKESVFAKLYTKTDKKAEKVQVHFSRFRFGYFISKFFHT